jgi:glutathione S-transferase
MADSVAMSSESSSGPILFYDIASGPPVRPFAPNPWKTRYALNFKRANFVTEWVDLSEVTSTRKNLGANPVRFFGDGEPFYTLPVIKDISTNTIVGDSFDIAVYLDKTLPNGPLLFRHSIGLYAAFNAHVDSIFPTAALLFSHGLPFNPQTAEQCKAEFCRRSGKKWEELTVSGEERKKVFFRFSDGPFIGGEQADYADIIVGAWLMFLSHTVTEWEEIRTWHDGLWGRLHDALKPYEGTW